MADILCPICKRVGKLTAIGGDPKTFTVVGLDPTCAGCRKALEDAGFNVPAVGPPGANFEDGFHVTREK